MTYNITLTVYFIKFELNAPLQQNKFTELFPGFPQPFFWLKLTIERHGAILPAIGVKFVTFL